MGKRKGSRKQRVQATAEAAKPDPEVSDRPTRRVFTKEYKQQILDEADAIKDEPGAIGAILTASANTASRKQTPSTKQKTGQ
jgi:protein-disulfide isomerase-like protein with CxxC motif